MCLDVFNNSKSDKAPVVQWPCTGMTNQEWERVPDKDGWFFLKAAHSGRCLDLLNGKDANGVKFQQYACIKDNPNQLFKIVGK